MWDIIGNKVKISADSLAIQPFKDMYNNAEDQALVEKYIEYIVFMNKPNSPYVLAYPPEVRASKVKADLFKDEDYVIPDEVTLAEVKYKEITETPASRLLKSVRNRQEELIKYFNTSDAITDDAQALKIVSMFEKMGKLIKSLDDLEKQVAAEQIVSNKIRGNTELGIYELPKNKFN
jgi:hypothetical protein